MSARDALDKLIDFFEADPQLKVATVARPLDRDSPPEGRVLNLAGDAEPSQRQPNSAARQEPR